MKPSGIGGQAVIEGVMMKGKEKYAVAVRTPDNKITIDVQNCSSWGSKNAFFRMPIVRGVVNFVESLVIGMKTLTYSASFYEDEEDDKKDKSEENVEKKSVKNDVAGVVTVMISLVIAIAMFMVAPFYISRIFSRFIESETAIIVIESFVRIGIFIIYIVCISFMNDIKRVFMYHGAEHKCINCIEHGMELNVPNVMKSSRQHKRCGTSFLLIVMIITMFVFMFVRFDSMALKLVSRIILIPLIAGISYEFLRYTGTHDSKIVNFLSKPGLWLQGLTTREPDESMAEVAIASVEAVFDWKKFLEEDSVEDGK